MDYRDAASEVDETRHVLDSIFSSFLSFSEDVPKDYRHVSLTGVKQRFEDEAYQHIGKDKVLCFVLQV